jgi:hypothetical protein
MDVPIREFYKEVTGTPVSTTRTAQAALERWGVACFSNTPKGSEKTYWRVDLKHLEHAKNAYAKEQEKKAAKAQKAHAKALTPDNGLMQRMANVEQELRTLNGMIKPFIEKFQ